MKDPELVFSGRSGPFSRDGITVQVSIVRMEDGTEWTLEVENASGTSIVWDDQFPTDEAAWTEFMSTVEDEGMKTFLDDGNVIPLRPQ